MTMTAIHPWPSVAEPEVSQDHITPLPMSEETQVRPLIGNSALFKTSDWPQRILELRCQSDLLRMLHPSSMFIELCFVNKHQILI